MLEELASNTELIPTIGSVLTCIVTVVISLLTARHEAKKEIQKINIEWSLKQQTQFDEDFAAMLKAVAEYSSDVIHMTEHCLPLVAAMRGKTSGELGDSLDALYHAIRTRYRSDLDPAITAVVAAKRKQDQMTQKPYKLIK